MLRISGADTRSTPETSISRAGTICARFAAWGDSAVRSRVAFPLSERPRALHIQKGRCRREGLFIRQEDGLHWPARPTGHCCMPTHICLTLRTVLCVLWCSHYKFIIIRRTVYIATLYLNRALPPRTSFACPMRGPTGSSQERSRRLPTRRRRRGRRRSSRRRIQRSRYSHGATARSWLRGLECIRAVGPTRRYTPKNSQVPP